MTATLGNAQKFAQFLIEAWTPLEPGEDRTVSFDDPGRMVIVTAGALDLFAVELVDDNPSGRWTFLNRMERGAILTGAPGGPRHRIIGRPVLGSTLCTLPHSVLAELSAHSGHDVPAPTTSPLQLAVEQFIAGVEQGITALAEALRTALPPRDFVALVPSGPTEVEDEQAVRSVDSVQWVTVEQGAVEVADGVAGRVSARTTVCITERDWLIAHGATRLTARSARDLLVEADLRRQWVTTVGRLLYVIDRRVERGKLRENEMLAARRTRDEEMTGVTAALFESVLEDADVRGQTTLAPGESPTLAAARLVAERGSFRVKAPVAGSGYGRATTELQAIATASNVRTRSIRLDGKWWTRDHGAMIGYRKIRDAPVALLPIGAGYLLVENGRSTKVDAKVAETLRNIATVLYRPLHEDVRDVRSLLRFGLHDNGRDLRKFAGTGLLVAVTGLLVPIMTGVVLGKFVGHAQRGLIVGGSVVVIASAFVVAALSIVQNIAALRIESRSAEAMQVGVWTRLLSLPASFFSKYSAGELGTTVLGVSSAQETLSGVTTTAALGLLIGLANLVLVFFLNLWLALLATGLVVIGAAVAGVAGYYQVRAQRQLYDYEKAMSSRVFQILSAMPKLRVAAAEERAFGRWSADTARGRRITTAARRTQNLVTTFNAGYPIIGSALIFLIVAGPLQSDVPIGTFLTFFTAFNLLLAASLQFTATAVTALGIVPMLEELQPILDARPEVNDLQADPGELSGQVSLSHVSFRYSPDSPLVLDDVTIDISPGDFVALVGPSGSGKSTVLRLLLGFEAPTYGTVLYDGQSLAELEVSAVRRQCGAVLQNGALLAASIKTNIIGSGNFTLEDAWAAAEMAGIADAIKSLPMGMNTVLSDGANTFSGGQRQRLIIARALVSRPRILFLDEATSALDNPTQQIVADATRKLNASRLVIAHRLSTVAEADRIIVLDRGRVVQQGQFESLLADRNGLFAKLARRQT